MVARAPPCSITSGRSSGVTGSPSSPSATGAATCLPSAAPSTARSTLAGRWAAAEEMLEAAVEDFSRSRPAMVGGPLVGLAELRRRQARPDEAAGCSTGRAGRSAQLCRARLALDEGDAARAVELVERLLRQAPAESQLDRAPALELLVRARVARGELEQAARRSSPCGRSSGWSGPSRCAPSPSWPRACSRPPAVSTSGRERCSRTPSIAFSGSARRSRPRRRGSSWRCACLRSVAPRWPSRRRRAPAIELVGLGAGCGGAARATASRGRNRLRSRGPADGS